MPRSPLRPNPSCEIFPRPGRARRTRTDGLLSFLASRNHEYADFGLGKGRPCATPPPIDRHRRRREEEEARRYIAFPQWLFSPFLSALNCSLMPCRPPSLSPWSASNVFHIYVLRYFIARPADAWNAHTPRSGVVPLHGVHYVLFGRVRVRTPYAACNGSPANGDWGYADG